MSEPNNGRALSITRDERPRYTGELLLRTRPKTYRAIVRELAEPNARVNGISRRYRVSNHTVMGIREREAKSITERKKHLVSLLADVATVGAERMSEKIGKDGLRDAAIGTGIAVDKMVALTGQMPAVQVAVVMPTAEETRGDEPDRPTVGRHLQTRDASPAGRRGSTVERRQPGDPDIAQRVSQRTPQSDGIGSDRRATTEGL